MNLSTFIILAIIVILFVLALRNVYKKRKAGDCGCGCGCGCSACNSCHTKDEGEK